MFSIGDALIVGLVFWFVTWLLKRLFPRTFASPFTRALDSAVTTAAIHGLDKRESLKASKPLRPGMDS